MKAPNFIFVNLMATLRQNWVSDTPCQRLAVLVFIIGSQILVNQALTELALSSTKDYLEFNSSCDCFFVSVGIG